MRVSLIKQKILEEKTFKRTVIKKKVFKDNIYRFQLRKAFLINYYKKQFILRIYCQKGIDIIFFTGFFNYIIRV